MSWRFFIPVVILIATCPALISFSGCKKQEMDSSNIDTTTIKPASYLALGDSYTIGQSVAENERFPAQTVALLKKENINVGTPKYIATTGWATVNLMSAISSQNLSSNYDIVTLLIGVNDQYQQRDTALYKPHFTQLLVKAIELAGSRPDRVFVLSIPDYSVTPFVADADKQRVRKEVDWYNSVNKEITLQHNVAYVDITPASREAAANTALIATDDLHPSGLQYKKWAELLEPLVKQALQ